MHPTLKQYNFGTIIDLNEILTSPYNQLYTNLKPLWKEAFAPNERIVLKFNGIIPESLITHLQKIVTHIDISNCFILLLTKDPDIESKLTQAARDFSHSNDVMQYLSITFDSLPIPVTNPTNFDLPKTLCAAPWAKIEIDTGGKARPCCAINNFKIGNTSINIKEIYFDPKLKKLRSELLAGETPASCSECWINEQAGVKSIREHIWWEINDDRYNIDWQTDTLENLKSLALALGNVCNLKCRVCNDNSSSSWAAEEIMEISASLRKSSPVYLQLKDKSWIYQDMQAWNEIKNIVPLLHELRFTGGEPMLIDQQFSLIEYVAETEYAKDIILRYTTNGTIFPDAVVDIWKKFKLVEIALSIDDIGARFEYQRDGSNWLTVSTNIQKYLELANKYNFVIKIHCTVSNQNIFYLPEICDYFEQLDVDHCRLNMLHLPSEFSILNIPTQAKVAVLDRLTTYNFSKKFKSDSIGIVQALRTANENDGSELIKTLKKIDLRRNQSFAADHTKMATLIGYL